MTSLDAVSAKLDDLKEYVGLEFGEVKKRQDKTNGRVRDLEKFRWAVGGFCLCITIVVIPMAWKMIDFHLGQ